MSSDTSETSGIDKKILCTKHQNPGVEHYSLLIPGKDVENVANQTFRSRTLRLGWLGCMERNGSYRAHSSIWKDYTTENFAQEAALKDYISFNKGCYIGQEPNARLFFRGRPQKQLVSISIPASLTTFCSSPLFSGSELVGEITTISASSS